VDEEDEVVESLVDVELLRLVSFWQAVAVQARAKANSTFIFAFMSGVFKNDKSVNVEHRSSVV
jgi:hypothetical protein